MSDPSPAPRVSPIGYGLGFGAAFAAVVGTVLHFAYPDVPDWLSIGGAFVVGAAIGAVWARMRGVDLGEGRKDRS
jgi:hypothetical protein